MNLGLPMLGTTSTPPDDDDYYRFKAPKSGDYEIILEYPDGNSIYFTVIEVIGNSYVEKGTFRGGYAKSYMSQGKEIVLQLDPYYTKGSVNYTLTINLVK